jgi:hypothetical protein
VTYHLHIFRKRADGLFLVNRTQEILPLAPLRLHEGSGAVRGSEWGVVLLEKDACVTVWKDKGEPQPPDDLECTHVGERLVRDKRDRFWEAEFNVYYAGQQIGSCKEDEEVCSFQVIVQPTATRLLFFPLIGRGK